MKEIITQMITEYLPVILTAVMTAIVGFVKSKYTKIANDSIKKDVAATTVKYIEQIYKDVHGTEKLEKAKRDLTSSTNKKYGGGSSGSDKLKVPTYEETAIDRLLKGALS